MQKPRIKKCSNGIYVCGVLVDDPMAYKQMAYQKGFGLSPKTAYNDWVKTTTPQIVTMQLIESSALKKDNCKSQIFSYGSGHVFKFVGSDDLTLWQKIKRWWDNG